MKASAVTLGLIATANALVAKRSSCCFHLDASGAVTGTVGQLDDGQNRVGGGLPPAEYCIDSGGITDSNGRGCILTPPTTQFQCDAGASPTTGFSVECDGTVAYNGGTTFYECQTGQNGESNIYTTPGGTNCDAIALKADGCGSCPPPPPPPPPPSSASPSPSPAPSPSAASSPSAAPSQSASPPPPPPPPPPSSSAAPSQSPASPSQSPAPPSQSLAPPAPAGCPTNLNGDYQFPHLIVPIDSSQPDKASGTSYFGQVSSTISSIFNFDIPQSYSGHQCSLVFLFPKQDQLETSSFTFSGNGGIDFSLLSNVASQSTSFSNAPGVKTDYGVTTVAPGNSYEIATFECPAGTAVSFELKASGDTSLNYFQDYNPSPIGLYITTC